MSILTGFDASLGGEWRCAISPLKQLSAGRYYSETELTWRLSSGRVSCRKGSEVRQKAERGLRAEEG